MMAIASVLDDYVSPADKAVLLTQRLAGRLIRPTGMTLAFMAPLPVCG